MKKLSKSKMKIVVCVLCVVCVFSLVGVIYWVNMKSGDVQMPNIVFTYSNYHRGNEEEYDIWFIDRTGSVYQTHNEEYLALNSKLDNYSKMIVDESVYLVKKVDIEVLKNKYEILLNISRDGMNEEIELPEEQIHTELYR